MTKTIKHQFFFPYRPLTINSLAENFQMSRPSVSKHVKILYGAGFISIKDVGRERYCTLQKVASKSCRPGSLTSISSGHRDSKNWKIC
jgi:DNA-binding transcriptional ArsR family regulator